MEGISELHRREVGVNLTGGRTNAVEICQKIMAAPALDDVLANYRASKAKKPMGAADITSHASAA
jgi:hypothetical protein